MWNKMQSLVVNFLRQWFQLTKTLNLPLNSTQISRTWNYQSCHFHCLWAYKGLGIHSMRLMKNKFLLVERYLIGKQQVMSSMVDAMCRRLKGLGENIPQENKNKVVHKYIQILVNADCNWKQRNDKSLIEKYYSFQES